MHLPQDLQEFKQKTKLMFGGLFIPDRDIYIARSPVSMDIMGGTADFSGSVMLGSTLENAVIAGIQKRRDMRIIIKQVGLGSQGQNIIDFHFNLLQSPQKTTDSLNQTIRETNIPDWAALILRLLYLLVRHDQVTIQNGVTIGIHSTAPLNTGVNTETAMLTAVSLALKKIFDMPFNGFQMAEFCQQTSRMAGYPAGIMAPLTCSMGKKDKFLAVRCQPHELLKIVPLSDSLQLIGIDCQLIGNDLHKQLINAEIAAGMGKIILESITGNSPIGGGYLSNLSVKDWESQYSSLVPDVISGKDFQQKYQIDNNILIDPDEQYHIKLYTKFPIYENERALQFIKHIEAFTELHNKDHLIDAGTLMYASNDQVAFQDSHAQTRFIMDYVREQGPDKGYYGARIAGCGCGSTVVVLADKQVDDDIATLTARYNNTFQAKPLLFRHSSTGALDQGTIINKL